MEMTVKSAAASTAETTKRDIIEEYADFGSKVYAPLTRDGLSLDKKGNKFEVHPEALTTYQGIKELHATIP